MLNRLITLAIFAISAMQLFGQSIAGDWEGQLEVQGSTLKIIFHISESEGKYSSTMDSPNQGAFDIEMDETTFNGTELTIKNAQMNMKTVANYDVSEDLIQGKFNQGPMSLPLQLKRIKKEAAVEPTNDHPIAGDWNGALNIMGNQLRLVFHVTEQDGTLSSTMDSPDQKAFGFQMDETTFENNMVIIKAAAMNIKVEGTYLPDSNLINGKFYQNGQTFPLKLIREAIEKKEVNRPQEPKSFDYKVEEVKFTNPEGGHVLAGTLTIPKSGEFTKVAVLVSGSGPQDRNEELVGHKPFLVLSDFLTKNGVAVLRYDDRGVGESTGEFSAATSMDLAKDAGAAVKYLRERADMEDKKVGIIGHSEGGLIAPIVASQIPLDYAVLLAGPGIDSDEVLLGQAEAISRANGVDEKSIESNLKSSKKVFDFMKENREMPLEELRAELKEILREDFQKLSEEDKAKVDNLEEELEKEVKGVTTPWFRYFIGFSPKPYLEQLTIPVLAVNGAKDLQVLADSNLEGIEEGLKVAGNKNYKIVKFDNLNHLFQKAETGSPNEYGSIEETFNQEALDVVLNWVKSYDSK